MEHIMKLQPKYYNYMLNGTKRIEIRLNDAKRRLIKVGDTIKFLKEPKLEESFIVRVVELLRYDSFETLFKNFDISDLADKSMSKDELINIIGEFYTKEEENKYGVLGIRIELI